MDELKIMLENRDGDQILLSVVEMPKGHVYVDMKRFNETDRTVDGLTVFAEYAEDSDARR